VVLPAVWHWSICSVGNLNFAKANRVCEKYISGFALKKSSVGWLYVWDWSGVCRRFIYWSLAQMLCYLFFFNCCLDIILSVLLPVCSVLFVNWPCTAVCLWGLFMNSLLIQF